MKIYLIRHGEKIKLLGDIGLSDLGKRQSLLIGNYLKDLNIGKLYSSEKKRAIETSNIISNILNKRYTVSEYLNERINFGDIPYQSYSDFINLCKVSTLDRNYLLPNGETSITSGKRIESLINTIPHSVKSVALISHGGVIVDYLRNIFTENELSLKSITFTKYYMVNYGSITEVDLVNEQQYLKKLGAIEHLTEKH